MNTKNKKLACYITLVLTYSGLSQLWDIPSQSPMVSQDTARDQFQLERFTTSRLTANWPADGKAIGAYWPQGNHDPTFAVKSPKLELQLKPHLK